MEQTILAVDTAGLALTLAICWRLIGVFELVLRLQREGISTITAMQKDINYHEKRLDSLENCSSKSSL